MNAGNFQQPGTPFGPMGCQTDMPIMCFPTPDSAPVDPSQCCRALMYTPLSCCGNAPTIIITLPPEPEEPPNEGPVISFPPKVMDRKYPEKVKLPSIKLSDVLQRQTPRIQVTPPTPRRISPQRPQSVQAASPRSRSPGGGAAQARPVSPQRPASSSLCPGRNRTIAAPEMASMQAGGKYRFPPIGSPMGQNQFYHSADFNPSGLTPNKQRKLGVAKQHMRDAQQNINRAREIQPILFQAQGQTIKDEEEKKKLQELLQSYFQNRLNANKHFGEMQRALQDSKPQ